MAKAMATATAKVTAKMTAKVMTLLIDVSPPLTSMSHYHLHNCPNLLLSWPSHPQHPPSYQARHCCHCRCHLPPACTAFCLIVACVFRHCHCRPSCCCHCTAQCTPHQQRRAPTRQPRAPHSPTRSTQWGSQLIGPGVVQGQGGIVAWNPWRRQWQRPMMLTSALSSRSPKMRQLMVHPALGGVSGEGWASLVVGL
jgi:hypothetical protein